MKPESSISYNDFKEMILKQGGLERCVLCGKCAAVCPSLREFNLEVFSPRGRMALASAFLEKNLAPGSRYLESLSSCLFCRSCEKACPARVRPGWIDLLLKNLSEFRKLHKDIKPIMKKDYRERYPKNLFDHLGWKPSAESFAERFIKSRKKRQSDRTSSEVLYFPGCVNDNVFPDAARSTASLLERLGLSVIVYNGFYCCGAPYIFVGNLKEARSLVEKNLGVFGDYADKTILCDCSQCAGTISLWSDLFMEGSEEKKLAEKLAGNTRILSDFLEERFPFIFPGVPKLFSRISTEEFPCPGWPLSLLQVHSDLPERILEKIVRYIEDEKITSLVSEDSAFRAFMKKKRPAIKTVSLGEFLLSIPKNRKSSVIQNSKML